ncbi:hypothetical protein PCE1_003881 [Barthelona sp. PCE]
MSRFKVLLIFLFAIGTCTNIATFALSDLYVPVLKSMNGISSFVSIGELMSAVSVDQHLNDSFTVPQDFVYEEFLSEFFGNFSIALYTENYDHSYASFEKVEAILRSLDSFFLTNFNISIDCSDISFSTIPNIIGTSNCILNRALQSPSQPFVKDLNIAISNFYSDLGDVYPDCFFDSESQNVYLNTSSIDCVGSVVTDHDLFVNTSWNLGNLFTDTGRFKVVSSISLSSGVPLVVSDSNTNVCPSPNCTNQETSYYPSSSLLGSFFFGICPDTSAYSGIRRDENDHPLIHLSCVPDGEKNDGSTCDAIDNAHFTCSLNECFAICDKGGWYNSGTNESVVCSEAPVGYYSPECDQNIFLCEDLTSDEILVLKHDIGSCMDNCSTVTKASGVFSMQLGEQAILFLDGISNGDTFTLFTINSTTISVSCTTQCSLFISNDSISNHKLFEWDFKSTSTFSLLYNDKWFICVDSLIIGSFFEEFNDLIVFGSDVGTSSVFVTDALIIPSDHVIQVGVFPFKHESIVVCPYGREGSECACENGMLDLNITCLSPCSEGFEFSEELQCVSVSPAMIRTSNLSISSTVSLVFEFVQFFDENDVVLEAQGVVFDTNSMINFDFGDLIDIFSIVFILKDDSLIFNLSIQVGSEEMIISHVGGWSLSVFTFEFTDDIAVLRDELEYTPSYGHLLSYGDVSELSTWFGQIYKLFGENITDSYIRFVANVSYNDDVFLAFGNITLPCLSECLPLQIDFLFPFVLSKTVNVCGFQPEFNISVFPVYDSLVVVNVSHNIASFSSAIDWHISGFGFSVFKNAITESMSFSLGSFFNSVDYCLTFTEYTTGKNYSVEECFTVTLNSHIIDSIIYGNGTVLLNEIDLYNSSYVCTVNNVEFPVLNNVFVINTTFNGLYNISCYILFNSSVSSSTEWSEYFVSPAITPSYILNECSNSSYSPFSFDSIPNYITTKCLTNNTILLSGNSINLTVGLSHTCWIEDEGIKSKNASVFIPFCPIGNFDGHIILVNGSVLTDLNNVLVEARSFLLSCDNMICLDNSCFDIFSLDSTISLVSNFNNGVFFGNFSCLSSSNWAGIHLNLVNNITVPSVCDEVCQIVVDSKLPLVSLSEKNVVVSNSNVIDVEVEFGLSSLNIELCFENSICSNVTYNVIRYGYDVSTLMEMFPCGKTVDIFSADIPAYLSNVRIFAELTNNSVIRISSGNRLNDTIRRIILYHDHLHESNQPVTLDCVCIPKAFAPPSEEMVSNTVVYGFLFFILGYVTRNGFIMGIRAKRRQKALLEYETFDRSWT